MRGMIHSSERATNFVYAIRNVVNAAEVLERQGRQIIHLNIGDPQSFGFSDSEQLHHLIVSPLLASRATRCAMQMRNSTTSA